MRVISGASFACLLLALALALEFYAAEGWSTYKGLIGNLFGHRSNRRCRCSCGVTNRKSSRLVGGKTTGINEYPWTAALLYKGHYYCGGTLINERYVLTAAHCIRGVHLSHLKVLLGEHVRTFPIETNIVYYDVIYSVFHHLFNSSTFNNDIGLVKTGSKVPFKWYSRPACLPDTRNDYEGDLGIVTGWGKTHEYDDIAVSLQQIVVPVIPNEVCRDQMSYQEEEITDNMICAGYINGRMDSCHGDSGGALLWEGPDSKMVIIGVVSWGHGCGRRGFPGLYTKVDNYLEWIAFHTRDTCFCGRRQPRSGRVSITPPQVTVIGGS